MGNDMCFCHRKKEKVIINGKSIKNYTSEIEITYELSQDLTNIIDHDTKINLVSEYRSYNLVHPHKPMVFKFWDTKTVDTVLNNEVCESV